MIKRVCAAAVAGALLLAPAVAGAREPSSYCDNGEIPPSHETAGFGVRQSGDPLDNPTSVYVCHDGRLAPVPIRGSARIRIGEMSRPSVIVVADGDELNTSPVPCSDGFTAVRIDEEGPGFHSGADGDWAWASRRKSAGEWIFDMGSGCLPATP